MKRNLIWSLIFKGRELDRECSLDHVYIRQRFFISLVRRIEKSRRDGNARAVFALSPGVYLGGDSQPIVARRRKGNRRRYSCPTALLSSCCATPCSDVAGNRHFRIARHSREIYLQFSLAESRSIALLEAPPIPRGKSNDECHDECHDEFKILDIKVSGILETRLLI